jgi:hypothetical protein
MRGGAAGIRVARATMIEHCGRVREWRAPQRIARRTLAREVLARRNARAWRLRAARCDGAASAGRRLVRRGLR